MAGSERAALICFLSSEHPPLDKRVFQKEARSLVEAGFSVTHLCPGDDEGCQTVDGVQVVTYARRRGKRGRLVGLGDLFRRARRIDADAYHCNEPDSWVVGVAIKFVARRPVVFDCHEHYPSQVVRWLPRPLHVPGVVLTRFMLQFLGLLTDRIVLAKPSVAEDFSLSRRRQLVVLNTTALRNLDTGPEPAPEPAGECLPFRFVHLGVIRRERGSDQLIDAAAELHARGRRDFEVVIIGDFKDGSREAFFDRAAALGLSGRFVFHEWMPFADAFRMVRGSDAGLVLFQRSLGNNVRAMPHKLFDYMLAGIPVIAPDFAVDVATIIKETGAGLLVDTGEPADLADAMESLMTDRQSAREMGSRGQRAVRETYNWEREAEKLVAMYRGLFDGEGLDPRRELETHP